MLKTKADSRTRLLRAAEKTTYLCGFGNTSIADCEGGSGSSGQRLLLLQDQGRDWRRHRSAAHFAIQEPVAGPQ